MKCIPKLASRHAGLCQDLTGDWKPRMTLSTFHDFVITSTPSKPLVCRGKESFRVPFSGPCLFFGSVCPFASSFLTSPRSWNKLQQGTCRQCVRLKEAFWRLGLWESPLDDESREQKHVRQRWESDPRDVDRFFSYAVYVLSIRSGFPPPLQPGSLVSKQPNFGSRKIPVVLFHPGSAK